LLRRVEHEVYSGLIADFGGVLTTSFEGALRSFCVREGLAPDALEKIFSVDAGAHGALRDLERGKISQAEFVAHLAPALGVCAENLLERILADLRSEPTVTSAVQGLRSVGIRVCVLTNSWGTSPYDPYAPFHLDDHYDAVVVSHQVGLRKPEPEIFLLAAEKIRLEPEQCVFVDDVAHYLDSARALGMGVVHATEPTTTVAMLNELFDNRTR
jgi:putative hydrolase of the HAD superfamily